MQGWNRVTLFGTVGQDAEVKELSETATVANFSLATNESYKDKAGNKQTNTEWHSIEVWNGLAKFAGAYVKKGTNLLIEGSLKTEKYKNKEGVDVQRTKIKAINIMLGPSAKKDNDGGQTTSAPASQKAATAKSSKNAESQVSSYANAAPVTSESFLNNNESDDLPF